MLDFRIDTFLEVCRFMNYTRAAQELNLTQPAVSQHIRWLEEQYQAKLFCYENKQLSLTKSGELLRSAAITMKQDETYLRRKIRQIRQTENDLSFGVTPTVGMYLIPGPLAEYQKNIPMRRSRCRWKTASSCASVWMQGRLTLQFWKGTSERLIMTRCCTRPSAMLGYARRTIRL